MRQTQKAVYLALLLGFVTEQSIASQPQDWRAGIARVKVRADLNRSPGTAIVVEIRGDTAYLLTSAHVVRDDASPEIEFIASPAQRHRAIVRHIEGDEKRGLSLLVVEKPPAGLRAIPFSGQPSGTGDSVTVAGFPASLGSFSVLDTSVAAVKGRDLFLSRETDDGFSGGPVLRGGAVVGLIYGHDGDFGIALRAGNIKEYLDGHGVSWRVDGTSPAQPASREEVLKLTAVGIEYVRRGDLSWVQSHARLPFFFARALFGTRASLSTLLSDNTATVRKFVDMVQLVKVTAHPVKEIRSRDWFLSVTNFVPIPLEDTDWAALIVAKALQQPSAFVTWVAFYRSEDGAWKLVGISGGEGLLE